MLRSSFRNFHVFFRVAAAFGRIGGWGAMRRCEVSAGWRGAVRGECRWGGLAMSRRFESPRLETVLSAIVEEKLVLLQPLLAFRALFGDRLGEQTGADGVCRRAAQYRREAGGG